MRVGAAGIVLASLLANGIAAAHDFSITDVLVVFKADGRYQIDMTVDVDALALGVSPEADSARIVQELESMSAAEYEACVERARDTLLRRVRIRFDGDRHIPEVGFPDAGTRMALRAEVPTVLGTTARFEGVVPQGAEEFTFGASRAFRAVHLTILDQAAASGARYPLSVGQDSPPWVLGAAAQPASRAEVTVRYVGLGFEHILPRGVDHILFVLGLFLLGTRMGSLLWQVTAFTVAHTVTLALSMYGVVSLPSRLVETLIALSITYVAVENVFTTEMRPWRPALVFAFGLLHGLGFADVLKELGLPRGEYVTALVSFNIGVELGQLTVIALAFLAIGWFRNAPWYRKRVVVPLSILIALVGAYWAVERALG